MLSKVDKGEFSIPPEKCDRIDWVDTGDEDKLWTPRDPSKSKSV
jgi:hypothetical protein